MRNISCKSTYSSVFPLWLFVFFLATIAPSFAMVDDDEAQTIPQFIRHLENMGDHWNIENQAQIFSIPLPHALYPPHPPPNFAQTLYHLSELRYNGTLLRSRREGERWIYEGIVDGENIALDVRFTPGGVNSARIIPNRPEINAIIFGPQSFSLRGNDTIFDGQLVRRGFIPNQPLQDQRPNNLRDCLNSIRNRWQGCPTLTYEGVLAEGPRLNITFRGHNNGREEFHPLSPTTLLYALDTVQRRIGVFVKIHLPHFGSQFYYLTEGPLSPVNPINPLPGQIHYDGHHIFQEVHQVTPTFGNPTQEWLGNWGPQVINPNNPTPWAQQLANFNQQQLRYEHRNPLRTVFVNPECQRPVQQGVARRRLPEGRYQNVRQPLQRKSNTIYSNGHVFTIVSCIERELRPIVEANPPVQSYIMHTYFDTDVGWERFDEDVYQFLIAGTFADNRRWQIGLYVGHGRPENNPTEWEKIDTLAGERTIYRVTFGNRRRLGELVFPERMTDETADRKIREISYFPLRSLPIPARFFSYQFLNDIFTRMENLRELGVNFHFNDVNHFGSLVNLLNNQNIQNNLITLNLRFTNCPAFNTDMATQLGTSLSTFRNLQALDLDIPRVCSYTAAGAISGFCAPILVGGILEEQSAAEAERVEDNAEIRGGGALAGVLLAPVGGVAGGGLGAIIDGSRWLFDVSYNEYLTLARTIANSHSLQTIGFHGPTGYDQTNIRDVIQAVRRNIVVRFD